MRLDRNETACECMSVTVGDIEDAIAAGAKSVEAVVRITKAGKGCGACGSCEELIKNLLQKRD